MSGARLSAFESILWRAGQDPNRRSTVGVLLLLDHAPEPKDLVAQVSEAIERAPRLRCRPDDPTFTHLRPSWVEEERPDPEHHVRVVGVPGSGTMRQVLDQVMLIEATPFDPDHSPWDLTLLTPVEGGRAALYARAHHVLTDGVGGVRLLHVLFDLDLTDSAPAPRPVPAVDPYEDERSLEDGTFSSWRSGRITIDLTATARTVTAGVVMVQESQPVDTLVRGFQRALDLANSVSRQMLVTGGPLSPLPMARSVMSHFDILSVPNAKEAAIALGGSRNDLLVAAATTGVALYAEHLGRACPKVRIAMPARQRRDGALGGNWFAPTRVEVPVSTSRPDRQFGVVCERLAQARHEPALAITDALASAVGLLPNRVLLPALHAQLDAVDLAVTTVPGPRGRPHLCGSLIEEAYPMGPRLGVPLNITAFGTGDRLDVGVTLDTEAFAEPEAFHECLAEAFRRLTTPVTVAR